MLRLALYSAAALAPPSKPHPLSLPLLQPTSLPALGWPVQASTCNTSVCTLGGPLVSRFVSSHQEMAQVCGTAWRLLFIPMKRSLRAMPHGSDCRAFTCSSCYLFSASCLNHTSCRHLSCF